MNINLVFYSCILQKAILFLYPGDQHYRRCRWRRAIHLDSLRVAHERDLVRGRDEVRAAVERVDAVGVAEPDPLQEFFDAARLRAYFTDGVVADFASSLAPLGDVADIQQSYSELRGGMVYRGYRIAAAGRNLGIATYFTTDGLLDQFLVYAR